MCNYVVTKAFENEALSKRIKESFIAIKVDSKHSDRNLVNDLYDLKDQILVRYLLTGIKI